MTEHKHTKEFDELKQVFRKIENQKDFKIWFGKPCPDFYSHCFNCKFWNMWNKFKIKLIKEFLK